MNTTVEESPITVALAALGDWLRENSLPPLDQRAVILDAYLRLRGLEVEKLIAYWLDVRWCLISVEEVSMGSASAAYVSRRYLARQALLAGASAVVLIHNHPNGDPAPSDADREAAEAFNAYLSFIGVPVIGHWVVAGENFSEIHNGVIKRISDIADRPTFPSEQRCPNCGVMVGGRDGTL